jgi:hypothetical protein
MRWISSALLLASLLIGLGHVAALPPFGGVDETAHYSYIEQVAKTGTLPRFGDKIQQDAQDYMDTLTTAPGPRVRSLWYHNLFTADAEVIKKVRQAAKALRDPSPRAEPGGLSNWEVQQPPFYYALLTPFYLLSARWSLAGQLALFRGLSYFVAWLSLCLAVLVAAKAFSASGGGRAMIAAPALWPFVFPGWFPEMARLGNDSLVALIVACAVAVFACGSIRRWSTWLLLGVICGLGALTKASFLPFLAAIALLLLYRTWRRDASPWQFLGFLATVLAVAGWWYFRGAAETGMLLPGAEDLALREKGGLIAGLMEHFSVNALAWVIPAAGVSFLWGGESSFVTPPLTMFAPLVVMSLLIGCSYLYGLYSYRMYPLVQLTALALGFWVLAIINPTLVEMALYGPPSLRKMGYGGLPEYYLHSLAPALAPIIGIAITIVSRNWLTRTVFWLLLGYNVVFLFGATFMQFLYYAGCGSNGSARFDIASASLCWNDWQRLTDHLDVLAFPLVAFGLIAGGAIALGWGACLMLVNSHTRNSHLAASYPSAEASN